MALSVVLIRVVAAVITRRDQLLVCQRPYDKRHGGSWEFPGGKREADESDSDALRRELHEELDLHVVATGGELFSIHDDGSPFLIAFIPTQVSGEPTCHEHIALRWGTLHELADLPLAPSDRRFVEFLLTNGEA